MVISPGLPAAAIPVSLVQIFESEICFHGKKGAPIPDTADGVEGGKGVVVRVAIVQVHVPRVRATVLSSGPKVVGGGLLPAADFRLHRFPSPASGVAKLGFIPVLFWARDGHNAYPSGRTCKGQGAAAVMGHYRLVISYQNNQL